MGEEPRDPVPPDSPDPGLPDSGVPDRGGAGSAPTVGPGTRRCEERPEGGGATGRPGDAATSPAPNPGASSPEARRLGPYEILSEIGRGGMGVVYKAFHPGLKRTVALKVLIAGEDASEEAIARFQREAQAVAKLGHHPNIVPVYDIGQAAGHGGGGGVTPPLHYIAMHYVEGRSLDRVIDEGTIAPRRAAEIAKKVADALAHAHSRGVLHRDVKPANILMAFPDRPDRREGAGGTGHGAHPADTGAGCARRLEDDGAGRQGGTPPDALRSGRSVSREAGSGESGNAEPMLTDFGLARDVESPSKMTRSGMTLGTPNYMPPEQAEGRLPEIDARSDVYSLGATLYEMLTGRPPFEGDSVAAVLRKVLLEDPRSPRRGNPSVDRDLETICLKCLEKERERRYASAAGLARDLANYLEGSPISARPASLAHKAMKTAWRHKGAVLGAATALVVSTVALAAAAVLVERKERDKRTGVAEERTRAAEERTRADEQERLREKNQGIAKVLMDTQARLGRIHRELKASMHDSTKTPEDIRAFYGEREGEIEAFFSRYVPPEGNPASIPMPASAAEQAVALALKGWFVRAGGMREEAIALFARAGQADPEVGWGYLLEAMWRLSDYFFFRRLPGCRYGSHGIEFDPMPPENATMKAARGGFERKLEEAGRARAWGVELSPGIAEAIGNLRTAGHGDPKEAEAAVSALLALPEFWWVEEELLFARSQFRYVSGDFAGGEKDLLRVLASCPDKVEAYAGLGLMRGGAAAVLAGRGADPRQVLREAIASCDEVLRRKPEDRSAFDNRGLLHAHLGLALGARGEDPREAYRRALEDHAEALKRDPGFAASWVHRGSAHLHLGDAETERGEDPRESYGEAIVECGEALKRVPGDRESRNIRGTAYRRLADMQRSRGEDARETYRRALADYDEALKGNPGSVALYVNRGSAFQGLGEAQEARREDARDAFRKAVEDHGEALKRDPDSAEAYCNRGNAFQGLGRAEMAKGEDARESYGRAIEDYDQALKRNPGESHVYNNRGNAYHGLGEAQAARGGDPREAFRKAVDSIGEALRRNPGYAEAYYNRGNAYGDLGLAQAERGEDPLDLFRSALADHDKAVERNRSLWMAHANGGAQHMYLGEFDEAAQGYRAALAIMGDRFPPLKQWLARAQDLAAAPAWARTLAAGERRLTWGWFAGTREMLEKGIREAEEPGAAPGEAWRSSLPAEHYNLACCLCHLSVGKKGRLAEPVAVPAEEAAALRAAAVLHLRKVLELGWSDLEPFRKDPDLDPVRNIPEFQAIMKEWENRLAKGSGGK